MNVAGAIAYYVMDGNRPLTAETSGNVTTFLYGLDAIAEQTTAWNYILPDGSHTPRQLTDSNGEITLSTRYTPWGDTLERNGTGNFQFGYPSIALRAGFGALMDEVTGLLYVGNGQYYDPSTGRFLTRNTNPNSPNPYLPFDPTGLLLGPLGLLVVFYAGRRNKKSAPYVVLLIVLVALPMSVSLACRFGGSAPAPAPAQPPATGTSTPGGGSGGNGAPSDPGAATETPSYICNETVQSSPDAVNETAEMLAQFAIDNGIYHSVETNIDTLKKYMGWLMVSAGYHKLNSDELAYVLATSHYESRWKDFDEKCDEGIPCEPDSASKKNFFNNKYANMNGNGNYGSGDGYTFRGRGFIHLTFRDNYRVVGGNIGFSLDAGYGYAEYAYCATGCPLSPTNYMTEIAVIGMKEGLASGRTLTMYSHPTYFDFEGARDIIHAADSARQGVANLAKGYATILADRCQLGGLPEGVTCRCRP